MGTLYLVRHGQASFGADDYDHLSALGTRQCHALGQWFAGRGITFGAVLRGTLRRHEQSLAAIASGYASGNASDDGAGQTAALPAASALPGLNEYESEAVIRTVHDGPLARPTTPEIYRHHFRLLRQGLALWMSGQAAPAGMPSWGDFMAGVAGALEAARQHHEHDVLLVSSGGPIATAVGQVLGTPAETIIELNLRIRNSAVTEFAMSARRCTLVAFNHLPHLDAPERRDWLSYA